LRFCFDRRRLFLFWYRVFSDWETAVSWLAESRRC